MEDIQAEIKLCRKGLHTMTPDNITFRKVSGNSYVNGVKRSYKSKSCKACYNFRMKVYMQKVRDKKKEGNMKY